jgi:twitching motility protein PilT
VNEVLIQNSAVSASIREGKIAKLNSIIMSGRSVGMVSMDDALMQKARDKIVSIEEAYAKALDKPSFAKEMKYNPADDA